MFEDKKHWYDGKFYDLFIAPNQDRMFGIIKEYIEPNAKILDVGCGTGRFSFYISDKCSSVTGIDLSSKNILTAKNNLISNPNSKIKFIHTSITEMINSEHAKFDYAVITYVIHEVNSEERLPLLNEIFKIADKIIMGDYLIPQPKGFWKVINELVEFFAGKEHYNNYKDFKANKGIKGLAKKGNYNVLHKLNNNPISSEIVVIEK